SSSDKKTRGKKKIEIKVNENEDDRIIAFSKKCTVIYKKIFMLYDLCGGKILFIVFSLAGKPYLFGHPSVESVAKHFSNTSQPLNETTDALVETYHSVKINLLVQDFNDVQDQLDAIKKKQKAITLDQQSHGIEIRHWWKTTIN
ncbi:hypothetical protein V6Z11_D06G132300, partial [Gossypium hirsutum]